MSRVLVESAGVVAGLIALGAAACTPPLAATRSGGGGAPEVRPVVAAQSPGPSVLPAAPVAAEDATPAALPDALYVNGDRITVEQVFEHLRPELVKVAQQRSPSGYRRALVELLKAQIYGEVQEVLLYQAATANLDLEQVGANLDQVVDQRIRERINQQFGGRQSRYEEHLHAEGRTLLEVRDELRREVIVSAYLQDTLHRRLATPTRQELMEFYEDHAADYATQEGRELWLIDIPFGDDAAAARAQAALAADELAAGKPFEEVARNYSRGLHAAEGGAWGEINTRLVGRYAVVSDSLFALQEQEISGIIEGPDGLFIVKTGRIRTAHRPSFTEIQPQLTERYRAAQFDHERRRLLQRLLGKAVVEPEEGLFLRALLAAAPSYEELAATPE